MMLNIDRVRAWLSEEPLPHGEFRLATLARFNSYLARHGWTAVTGRRLACALRTLGAVSDETAWELDSETGRSARVWLLP